MPRLAVSVPWDAPVKTIQGDLFIINITHFRVLWDAPEEDPGGSVATQEGGVRLQWHQFTTGGSAGNLHHSGTRKVAYL